MKERNDIRSRAEDLLGSGPHRRPYGVPEDYMSTLAARLERIPETVPAPRKLTLWDRILPYASVAAAFLVLVGVGGTILRKTAIQPMAEQEMMEFALAGRTGGYVMEEDEQEDMSFDEIEEYLVSSGMSSEHLSASLSLYTANLN